MRSCIEDFDLSQLNEPLLEWFDRHARVLPWRSDPSPYHVWISEIMLQQTRVEAVIPYYQRFLRELEDIEALSKCPEEKLLKLWEGLGYYNRVRNLKEAACQVMDQYQGCLPKEVSQLMHLKGIGSYTAGAIASIAYHVAAPAVDGNVFRVMTRICTDDSDITKGTFRKRLEQAISDAMPQDAPGQYNQALMDLGATICLPNGNPLCDQCPLSGLCKANQTNSQLLYPNKPKKVKRKVQSKAILIIKDGNHVVIQKRPKEGLLAGLYEFPSIDGKPTRKEILSHVEELGLEPLHIKKVEDAKHIFSHVEWQMTGYVVSVAQIDPRASQLLMVELKDIKEKYAFPSAFFAYMKYLNP